MSEVERFPKPGPELDALVATRVMQQTGRTEWYASTDGGQSGMLWTDEWISKRNVEEWIACHPVIEGKPVTLCKVVRYPRYSTDDGEAMSVVRKLRDALPSLVWQTGALRGDPGLFAWQVSFRRADVWAADPSFAAAVCLAALHAVDAVTA